MSGPVAFKLRNLEGGKVHAVALDPAVAKGLGRGVPEGNPAIVRVRDIEMLGRMEAGVFDSADAEVLVDGDWANALLIVAPRAVHEEAADHENPDQQFLDHVARVAPEIHELGAKLVTAIRSAGLEGELRQEGHRWVNRPLNIFTLAVQTRVKNFQFTLYGGTDRFGQTDFIRSDQNGYSRGWVRAEEDIPRFLELAKIAYARKKR